MTSSTRISDVLVWLRDHRQTIVEESIEVNAFVDCLDRIVNGVAVVESKANSAGPPDDNESKEARIAREDKEAQETKQVILSDWSFPKLGESIAIAFPLEAEGDESSLAFESKPIATLYQEAIEPLSGKVGEYTSELEQRAERLQDEIDYHPYRDALRLVAERTGIPPKDIDDIIMRYVSSGPDSGLAKQKRRRGPSRKNVNAFAEAYMSNSSPDVVFMLTTLADVASSLGEDKKDGKRIEKKFTKFEQAPTLPHLKDIVRLKDTALPDKHKLLKKLNEADADELVQDLYAQYPWLVKCGGFGKSADAKGEQAGEADGNAVDPVNPAPKPRGSRRKGGRPVKFPGLRELIREEDAKGTSNERIAAMYRQTHSREEKSKQVTATVVKNTRDNMKYRGQGDT